VAPMGATLGAIALRPSMPHARQMDLTDVFNEAHANPPSPTTTAVWRAAMGEEYPEGVDPYSWVSRSELAVVCDVVLATGGRLADVGCGRGGPGLWVAAATGADLVGIDIAQTGVDAATDTARRLGIEASFMLGSFEDLPLADGSVDVVMSIDAFLFSPDKTAATAELGRVIRPGGRLVMTSWDYHSQPADRPPQVDDHRSMLRAAGFEVERYDDTEDWLARQRATTTGMLARLDEIAEEEGADPGEIRAGIEAMEGTFDDMIRRFLVVARRTGTTS
jgi:SAM-dependent methyltransferase